MNVRIPLSMLLREDSSGFLPDLLEAIDVRSIVHGLVAAAILLAAGLLARAWRRTLERKFPDAEQGDQAKLGVYVRTGRIVILVPAIFIALHVVGVELTTFFTTGGLFAVALAFALKNVSENYVAGLMLRMGQDIKRGDVLEVDGIMVRVKSIGYRATIARTKDERDLIIPNSELVQSRVANYTYRDSLCRIHTQIGVEYGSDRALVRKVLEGVVAELPGQSDQHAPEVLLTAYGDSAMEYKVSVWSEEPWLSGLLKSNLLEAIGAALAEARIRMAYPQVQVHMDPHAEEDP